MKRGKVKPQLKIALALTISGVLVLESSRALAQSNIVPDGTLGNERSTVIPNFQGLPVEEITGGATRGANLFHSFQEFNVSAGRRAYFLSPNATIQNILARVTGNNPSRILGTLGTSGNSNPNLFLINPNGIIFGQNARLDVGGSFLASTASAVTFPNGIEFSATNSQVPPLLTISVPLGLQFGANPGRIVVQGNGQGARTTSDLIDTNKALRVPSNQTLALVGGEISLEGATLKTAGGRIELGSVAQNSLVTLTPTQNGFALGYGGVQNFGDIQLSQQATVDASGAGGGDVRVTGRRITLTDGSQIEASTLRSQPGGSLVVNASESVELRSTSTDGQFSSGLFALVYLGATGSGGDLTINTPTLLVRDGAEVQADTFGNGNAGKLTVDASGSVQLIGTSADSQIPSLLDASAEPSSSGNGGDLTINTTTLLVRDGAQVGAVTFGPGNGGKLTVNASGGVQLIGTSADGQLSSDLAASAEFGSSGNGGDLTINTPTLLVRDGAQVIAATFGLGNGGKLTVNASGGVQLIGISADGQFSSALDASAERGSSGNGGDLTINTTTLLVRDGAEVGAATFGLGNGGKLTVNASGDVQLIGTAADGQSPSLLDASAERSSSGNGGDLTINTTTLLVQDGAQVGAATFGLGNGGKLTVNASGDVQLIGIAADGRFPSDLGASAEPGSSGNGGDLTINTPTLLVRDGAQVIASTFGQGKAGNLTVNASGGVQVIGTSADGQFSSGLAASAERGSSGNGGDLTINTPTLLVRDGASVLVSSDTGQAGNLTIQANSVRLNGGTLLAQTAKSGPEGGANITLSGLDLLRMDNESLISANAGNQATGGNITIDSNLIVATPPTGPKGSDITANATQGKGGAVNITTQGLFGIAFRPKLTPKNDITVTSDIGLNGTFQLTTPGVDPSRGLVNLPTQITDASRQIVQNCRASRTPEGEENKFIITGRGGLPPSPNDPLQNDEAIAHWVTLDSDIPKKNNITPESVTPSRPLPTQLVEAQGWIINKQGQIVLTASSPTVTPQAEGFESAKCNTQ